MATNKKITDLSELSEASLANDDVLPIVDVSSGTTHKVRKDTLASALSGVSSISATSPIAVNQSTGSVTVSTGTIPVASGGTGATSLTDGGILLGSGTGAVTALAALAKGAIVVGDGSTDPQAISVGSNGTVLKANSSESLGVEWAADSAGAVTSYTNASDNRVITSVDSSTINGEAGTLGVTGLVTASAGVSATGNVSGTVVLAETDTDTSNTGSVTIDFSAHQNFVLTLTGNVTLANPSTESVGQAGVFVFIQDGTGSRTLSLGTDYESPAGAGITLSTAASAVDVVPYFVKASGSIQLGAPQLAFS